MAARCSGLNFKPETNEKPHTSHNNSSKRVSGDKAGCATSCRFRMPGRPELSPVRFLRRIGDKVAAAMRFVSGGRRGSPPNACSSGRSNSSIAPLDSHRAEAIKDCIEFINSSCSLQRSNSVPTYSC